MADDAVRRLYGLPRERFVEERDALARSRDEPELRKLRKPSLAAWAVNQLVRERTPQLDDLWEAADRLRAAHAGEGDFAAAAAAQREAVETLLASAAELLRRGGHRATDATLERVRTTLGAAAADPAARRRVVEGRLEEHLDAPGFGALG